MQKVQKNTNTVKNYNRTKNNFVLYLIICVNLLFVASCENDNNIQTNENENIIEKIIIPSGFPNIDFPEDNGFTLDRWQLGKKLFYDTRLSKDNSVSCGSCHNVSLAFSDSLALSLGVEKRLGVSNAPTLTNVAYNPYSNRDGGVRTLEMQVLVPIQEHVEFDNNIIDIAENLSKIPEYNELSQKAYNRNIDYYVIPRALATFERSMISGNSKYDKYLNNMLNLTENELKGKELFFSEKTNCSSCHNGFNFTNYNFENNGLLDNYQNKGRNRITNKPEDLGKFKVPTLRNIGFTSPYMHNGSLKTLEQVIEHYNSGGKNFVNKCNLIRPLGLTKEEMNNLRDFLITLNDYEFINKRAFYNLSGNY